MNEGSRADGRPTYDLIVVGDQVVVGEQVVPAAIAISGERIAALLDPERARESGLAARTIDATGKIVLPGPIDAHVHHRTLNDTADSWESLTRGRPSEGSPRSSRTSRTARR